MADVMAAPAELLPVQPETVRVKLVLPVVALTAGNKLVGMVGKVVVRETGPVVPTVQVTEEIEPVTVMEAVPSVPAKAALALNRVLKAETTKEVATNFFMLRSK